MKSIDALVEDIYKVLEVSPTGDSQLPVVAQTVVNYDVREARLRASNIGHPCNRKLWYDLSLEHKPLPLEPHTRVKFAYGDLIEDMVIQLAKAAGHTVEHEQSEFEFMGVKGHCDAVIDGVLVDVKSASPYAFDHKFRKEGLYHDDPFGYLTQLSFYAQALGMERQGFLVVNKVSGQLHFMEIPKEALPHVGNRIEELKTVMAMSTPPDRTFRSVPEGKSGNMKLDVNCSYCDYKHHCWPGLRKFVGSRGPIYLTDVRREPRMREVPVDA